MAYADLHLVQLEANSLGRGLLLKPPRLKVRNHPFPSLLDFGVHEVDEDSRDETLRTYSKLLFDIIATALEVELIQQSKELVHETFTDTLASASGIRIYEHASLDSETQGCSRASELVSISKSEDSVDSRSVLESLSATIASRRTSDQEWQVAASRALPSTLHVHNTDGLKFWGAYAVLDIVVVDVGYLRNVAKLGHADK